jgi:hypothetical protein
MIDTDRKRGFALMDPAKRAEISSRGGKSAHAKGSAHQFTSAEAKAAGSLGGKATKKKKRQQKETETT